MTEENNEGAIIHVPDVESAITQDDKAFDAAVQSGSYLAYIQLMTANAGQCKSGEFPVNHWAMVASGNYTDLGKEVDVLVLAWRPRAFEMTDDGGILSIYDPDNAEFQRIQEKADADSGPGAMCGPEFLIWLPEQQKFVTCLMGTKSARREAPNLKARIKKAATLTSHLIETKRYKWQAPLIKPCTAELPMPSETEMVEVMTKFLNPPKEERELAPETPEGEDQAR